MTELHTIIVYIRAGGVERVAFCACCPPVTVEVRKYETDALSIMDPALPMEPKWPERLSDGRWKDHEGVYRAVLHEPENE